MRKIRADVYGLVLNPTGWKLMGGLDGRRCCGGNGEGYNRIGLVVDVATEICTVLKVDKSAAVST